MGNRIYQQISSTLAGSHEYAAMAKLYDIAGEKKYDLDRPRHAADGERARFPRRAGAADSAIDSPAIQWFTKPYLAAGQILAQGGRHGRGVRAASGWRASSARRSSTTWRSSSSSSTPSSAASGERAREVFELLRGPDVAFVLVSSPEPPSVDEAIYFHDRLAAVADAARRVRRQPRAPRGAVDVRRASEVIDAADGAARAARLLARRPGAGGERLRSHAQGVPGARRRSTRARSSGRGALGGKAPVVTVPFFDQDIYDVSGLSQMVPLSGGQLSGSSSSSS